MSPSSTDTTRLLIGYGTLLDVASTRVTIGASADLKHYRPVIVPGFRRLFNLRPDHYPYSQKTRSSAIEAAALNVEPAQGLAFNGVAFEVSGNELRELDRRERYYERTSVEIQDFHTGVALGEAQVYCASPDAVWLCRDPERLLPRWRDIQLARGGAYRIGNTFGHMFDATTFLADGKTLMVERYQRHFSLKDANHE